MKEKLGILIFTLSMICGQANADLIPGSQINSGAWEISAYTYSDTGRFSHCTAAAYYPHNYTDLLFSINEDNTMTIGVGDRTSQFVPGSEFPVQIQVDRARPILATAYVMSEDWLFMSLYDLDSALRSLRIGRVLALHSNDGSLQYDLEGTFDALDLTHQCAAYFDDYLTPGLSNPSPPVGAGWQPTRDQERRMFELASAIAADIGQQGIRFRDTEDPMVIWDSPDETVWVGTAIGRVPGSQVDLSMEFGSDMSNLDDLCNGTLATIRDEYTASGIETVEITARCVEDSGDMQFETYIMRQIVRGELVEVVMNISGDSVDNVQSRSNQGEDVSSSVAILVASYLLE